jgi:hypothetical protein
MELNTFASTNNFITKRATQYARCFYMRAFFMPYCQVTDSKDNLLTAADSDRNSLSTRISISPLCDELFVGGEGWQSFFLPPTNEQLKMAQSTTQLHTVEVTTCQLAILNHFHPKDAQEMARLIRSVCTAAIKSETADYEDITCLHQFAEYVQELSNEHFAAAAEFQHQHKKFI